MTNCVNVDLKIQTNFITEAHFQARIPNCAVVCSTCIRLMGREVLFVTINYL